jgi:hypothetical protein
MSRVKALVEDGPGPKSRGRPEWLEPLWDQRRTLTKSRVDRAIRSLRKAGLPISLRTIAKRAEIIDGAPLSPNTIYRNEAAYELYRAHAPARPRTRQRTNSLKALVADLPPTHRKRVNARVEYLRRKTKDALVAEVLILKQLLSRRETEAATLREEILRLSSSGDSTGPLLNP